MFCGMNCVYLVTCALLQHAAASCRVEACVLQQQMVQSSCWTCAGTETCLACCSAAHVGAAWVHHSCGLAAAGCCWHRRPRLGCAAMARVVHNHFSLYHVGHACFSGWCTLSFKKWGLCLCARSHRPRRELVRRECNLSSCLDQTPLSDATAAAVNANWIGFFKCCALLATHTAPYCGIPLHSLACTLSSAP